MTDKHPCKFMHRETRADGSSVFTAPHEIWNEVQLVFPAGYFDEGVPEWVEVDSFVVYSNKDQR